MKRQNESCAARGAEKPEEKTLRNETQPAMGVVNQETGLAPCPFCGNSLLEEHDDPKLTAIVCGQCGGQLHSGVSLKYAKDRWNKRAPLTATKEKMTAEMRAMNDRWAAIHELLETSPGSDWDKAPFIAIRKLQEDLEGATRTPQETVIPVFVANQITQSSWLNEIEHTWFKLGYKYAATQTRAIPALSKCTPEELYFVVDAINREVDRLDGSLTSSHEPKSTVERENNKSVWIRTSERAIQP